MNEELKAILTQFAESGWDFIDAPSQEYLKGTLEKEALVEVIKQADKECGSCGCGLDPLYKKALVLLASL